MLVTLLLEFYCVQVLSVGKTYKTYTCIFIFMCILLLNLFICLLKQTSSY